MRILLLDIETAPITCHAWGLWDQRIGLNQVLEPGHTLCWAAKWLGDKKVMFNSVYASSPESMLDDIHDLLDAADVVIHYNGTKFDIPTLHKEFLVHNMEPPAPFKQVDLLKVVRKQFKFPSNKLDFVSQALGLGSKHKHKGHELWVGCMNDDEASWRTMERYNKQDVILLEKLYKRLLPWIHNHPSVPVQNHAVDAPACPTCGSENVQRRGTSVTKTQRYRRYQCQECGTWSRSVICEKVDKKNVLVRDS